MSPVCTDELKVLVLGGGPDGEREVSLLSSEGVTGALVEAGIEAHRLVIDRITAAELRACPEAVIFPVLHGPWGEGGPLQDILEQVGRPYVGCRPGPARLAMDKIATKFAALGAGIATLPAAILQLNDDQPPIPLPLVIKPVHEGSTIGLHICKNMDEWQTALERVRTDHVRSPRRVNMVEQAALNPRELTVGVLDGKALPVVEIRAASGLYDYAAKYTRNDTKYVVAPELPAGVTQEVQASAESIFRVLGCRHLARVDFLLDRAGKTWMLEVNTMPGFTTHSLFPMAAAAAGLDFPALTRRLVELALRRD